MQKANDTTDSIRWSTLHASHRGNGKKVDWAFRRCAEARLWFLRAPDGYVRTLETTWAASVPRIRAILDNHNMTAEVD